MRTIDTPALDELDELIETLTGLRDLAPLARVSAAASLDNLTRAALGRVGDEACTQAVNEVDARARRRTHADVAAELGVTTRRVSQRVGRYRLWLNARSIVAFVDQMAA